MKRRYGIGGETVVIEERGAAMEGMGGFPLFRLADDEAGIPLLHLQTECPLSDPQDDPAARPIHTFAFEGIDCSFFSREEGYDFRMQRGGEPPVVLRTRNGEPIQRSNIGLDREPDPVMLRFLVWMAYGVALAPLGGTAIHAAAIVWEGGAVLFLGESGTGKSTHARLWRETIPGAWSLNDDSPVLRIEAGEPVVYGSPWSGKTPRYRRERVPLAAVVRLRQAPENRIRRLGKLEALGALLPSCPPSFAADERLTDHLCRLLSGVIGSVPVFSLECRPDEAAAKLACETIFGR